MPLNIAVLVVLGVRSSEPLLLFSISSIVMLHLQSSRAVKQNIKSNVNKASGKERPHLGHTAGTSIDGLSYVPHHKCQNPHLSTVWSRHKLPTVLSIVINLNWSHWQLNLSMVGNFSRDKQVILFVWQRIKKAQRSQKNQYDKHVKEFKIEVSDLVMLKVEPTFRTFCGYRVK